MNSTVESVAPAAGRVLLALIFFMSGVGKVLDFEGTTGYMAAHGMPAVSLFLIGAIIFELTGGASIILGAYARWGAVLLIIFLIPTTLIFHNFWALEGAERQPQMINFMKNLSILGGLLIIVGRGAGAYSVDAKRGS